jgi:hypothetical protein
MFTTCNEECFLIVVFEVGRQASTAGQFGLSFSAGNSPIPGTSLYRQPAVRAHTPSVRPARHITPSGHWSLTSSATCFEPMQSAVGPRAALFSDQLGTTLHDRHSANMFADHCSTKYQEQSSVLYADQRNASAALYDQHNVIFSSPHNTVYNEQGTMYNDGWFCDLCNIALPTAIALSQVCRIPCSKCDLCLKTYDTLSVANE